VRDVAPARKLSLRFDESIPLLRTTSPLPDVALFEELDELDVELEEDCEGAEDV
jgi:hypothetical protein